MDSFLMDLIRRDTPCMNPTLANGLAVEHMRERILADYVHQVWKSAAKGFPEGLVYLGCKRCTPQEELAEVTRKKNGRREYDTAVSHIYMMKYLFSYNGKELPPRYLYLPFVGDAGSITISGARFIVSPILSDRVISIGVASIFVRLLRDRLTFESTNHHYMVDDRRETVKVSWAMIYHKNPKQKKLRPTVKANCTLMHYLFCKYGFRDTFLKFGNCTPVIGNAEINATTYPPDEWVICTSTAAPPKSIKRSYYKPSSIRIAIRKSEMTPMVRNMLGGFFYVVDHFPDRMPAEYAESKRVWKILLGHILFSGAWSEGKLHDDVADHISSLDEYLDILVIDKLKEIGVPVNDVYELFAVIVEKSNDWVLTAHDKVASMYDKELSILYYVLYEITSAIFKLYFKLKAASKKVLSDREVINTMNMTIKTGLIFSMTKNHGEVSTVSTPGDNKAFKATALLMPQSGSSRTSSRKDRTVLNDPSKRLHVSIAEIGGFANLPKAEPSGRSRLNPHARTDEKGVVLSDPRFAAVLGKTQQMIQRY